MSSKDAVTEMFSEVCSLEILFSILKTSSLPAHILLLKIMDLFLRNATIRGKFEQMKGFHLLAQVQQTESLDVSEELFGVLFCILLGKPAHRFPQSDFTISSYFLGQINDDISLQHTAAMVPILALVAAENVSMKTHSLLTLVDIPRASEISVKNVARPVSTERQGQRSIFGKRIDQASM